MTRTSKARSGVWHHFLERTASLGSSSGSMILFGELKRSHSDEQGRCQQSSRCPLVRRILGQGRQSCGGRRDRGPEHAAQIFIARTETGRDDIKAFMTDFLAAFPDLNFWGTADLIAQGDYVVGQWEGGGTHTGPAFNDFLIGGLPAATGRKMHFTGTTVLKLLDRKIVEEIGLDDGVTALTQLGLIKAA